MANQQQTSKTPISLRDSWQTPQWLFEWANKRFDFDIDLAANMDNTKCRVFIDQNTNSLEQDWSGRLVDYVGWCNPPYSETGKWLKKAWEEAQQGFRSVLLVPTPNGENGYRDYVFGKASEIIFINGRTPFVAGSDYTIEGKNGKPDKHIKKGDEVSGNNRGSCLIVYNRRYEGHTSISWVNRDDMKEKDSDLRNKDKGGN